MTEQEWLACDEPGLMLHWLLEREARHRKVRLFACLCGRQAWAGLTDERSRRAVAVAEGDAAGQRSRGELAAAHRAAAAARGAATPGAPGLPAWAAMLTTLPNSQLATDLALLSSWAGGRSTQRTLAQRCHWLRDLFGNPFRPVVAPAGWSSTVVQLAQAAYDERQLPSDHLNLARLAVLADALEATGARGDIVEHLRSPGPHVRGCWALDLLLGKA